jgi:hypothetical protein
MRARTIPASLLLVAGAAAAEPQTWQFTYTGFYNALTGQFEPKRTLAGEFTGEDLNDDLIIDSGELQTMIVYGERNYKGCQGEESPYYACGVGPFYFGPGNDLSFSLGEESHDRMRLQGGGHRIDTGDRDWTYRIVDGVEKPSRDYYWTPRTALQVSLVPEPAAWAMLAGGIGVLLSAGAMRKRRQGHS